MVLDPAWPALFSLCLTVAPGCGVLLHRCDAATAATIAAERRPLAIIMSNSVYAMDPAEFDALARDVRSTLVRLDEEVSERELEAMLNGALRDTREMSAQRDAARRDEGSGRYTLIGTQRSETVGTKGGAGADPRAAQKQGASADPQLVPRRGDPSSSQSTMPPPSSRFGSPPSVRTPLMTTGHSPTPVPPSSAPPSFRSPPSLRSTAPASSRLPAGPGLHATPGAPRSVPPPSARPLSGFAAQPAAAASGPLSSPPPSTRAAPSSMRAEHLSSPPPSVRAQPSTPPPSSRSLVGGPLRRTTPMPASSTQIPPPPSARSLPSPPSVRTLSSPPPSARAVPRGTLSGTEPPPSIRTMPPMSARLAPPSSVRPELSPRSGVRERSSEELDAVFEAQNLPLDALARGNRGSTPR
ncbi:hypothetical protein WMF37_28140 [Sorangium sp. So ce291]|uniref:hypothetical protein n=1 Tax=Sorangium sp. So ce291 TaxID=3133294 RepID=UPI003F6467E0